MDSQPGKGATGHRLLVFFLCFVTHPRSHVVSTSRAPQVQSHGSLTWLTLPQVFHKPADCQRGVFGCSRVTSPSPCGPYPESVPIPLLCHCECLEFYQLPEVLVPVTGHGFEDSLVGIMTSKVLFVGRYEGNFQK